MSVNASCAMRVTCHMSTTRSRNSPSFTRFVHRNKNKHVCSQHARKKTKMKSRNAQRQRKRQTTNDKRNHKTTRNANTKNNTAQDNFHSTPVHMKKHDAPNKQTRIDTWISCVFADCIICLNTPASCISQLERDRVAAWDFASTAALTARIFSPHDAKAPQI